MMSTRAATGFGERMKTVFYFQLAYCLGTMTWNIAGLILRSQGLRSPGPTASPAIAAFGVVIIAALVIGLRKWPVVYGLVSALVMLLVVPSILNAFTADPALWPSDCWRYAGAALNALGFVSCAIGVIGYIRWKMS